VILLSNTANAGSRFSALISSSSGWSDLFGLVLFVLAIGSLAHGCQLVYDLFNAIGPEMNVHAVFGNSDRFNEQLQNARLLFGVKDFPDRIELL
jgi:hypothetical protein